MNTRYSLLISFSLLLITQAAFSQNLYFERLFGDTTENCIAVSLVQLPSGNIIAGTNNMNLATSLNSVKLFKFDSLGNWMNTIAYPDTNYEVLTRLKLLPDGNLLFAGAATDSTGNQDGMLMKTDTSGNILWRTLLGRSFSDESLLGIDVTPDGGIISSGYTLNPTGPGNAFYLIKVDSAGNFLWDKIFSGSYNSSSDACIALQNGDIIISGDRQLPSAIYTNVIIHTDAAGDSTWGLALPNPYNNGCKNDILCSNGDILITGESATAGNPIFDPAITRIDTMGNIKWSYIYNGSAVTTDALLDVTESLPESFITTGYGGNPVNGSADVLIMRIDSAGNEINRTYYGDTTGLDIGYSIITDMNKRGCYIGGSSFRNGIKKGYLLFTDMMGLQTSVDETSMLIFEVYPNPASERLFISTVNNEHLSSEMMITDITGRVVMENKIQSSVEIPVSVLDEGIYIVTLSNPKGTFSRRFCVSR